jgi:hypothetical protein
VNIDHRLRSSATRHGEPLGDARLEEEALRRATHLRALGWQQRLRWDSGAPGWESAALESGFIPPELDFLDHLSRFIHKTTKRVVYVSEPYKTAFDPLAQPTQLDELRNFVEKIDWRFFTAERWSLHYPGRTTAIFFYRGCDIDDLILTSA